MLLNEYSLIEKKRRSCWLEKGVETKTAQKGQSQDFSAERSVPKNGVVAVTDGKKAAKRCPQDPSVVNTVQIADGVEGCTREVSTRQVNCAKCT